MPKTFKVNFTSHSKTVEVPAKTTVLEAARAAKLYLEGPCDGKGSCGKCKVDVIGKANKLQPKEIEILSPVEIKAGRRLACHARVLGDVEVVIARPSIAKLKIIPGQKATQTEIKPMASKVILTVKGEGQGSFLGEVMKELPIGTELGSASVLKELASLSSQSPPFTMTAFLYDNYLVGVEAGKVPEVFGLALDLGTTGLEAALVDLATGRELAASSIINPQVVYGHDVLTRIAYARSQPDGVKVLRQAAIEGVNRLIAQVCADADIPSANVYDVAVAGNTAMLHLFAGVNPASLGRAPYRPIVKSGINLPAADLGIDVSRFARVYIFPSVSAYVGGDILAGLLATEFYKEKGSAVFIDIGTNGEIVGIVDGRLTATSTAAGPALEGMNITHGCRAVDGAIDCVGCDDNGLCLTTINDQEPSGICGSGLIDLVAALLDVGLIDANGVINGAQTAGWARRRLIQFNGGKGFLIADNGHGPIVLSQKDIRQVQLAKGAIGAGLNVLLKQLGLAAEQVDKLLVAGNFGSSLNPTSLVGIGLVPPSWAKKIRFVGNTARAGAELALINKDNRRRVESLKSLIETIELSTWPDFDREFVAALKFPRKAEVEAV